ncbi:UDP-glucose 4-epimerase-like [Symsagittifera roscoffensis]|uniref:UDP-glucose 4-epimerase-like n=1 Tax=Symsagittifera roscoffensis TaxID=84072 RepID=UPI00307C0918
MNGEGGEDFGEGTCVLVTGGAGFIGSILTLELLVKGFELVVVDNCSNSYIAKGDDKPESLIRVERLANGKTGKKKEVTFYLMDILEEDKLLTIFQEHNFFCVMHLAGLKSVGESVKYPLKYYEVNMGIATNLLRCMDQTGVTGLYLYLYICTVYGPVLREQLPITEEQPTGNRTCAYGRTKYFIEQMLKDCCRANPVTRSSSKELAIQPLMSNLLLLLTTFLCYYAWRRGLSKKEQNTVVVCCQKLTCVSMRYFNPVGAHESGQIGEDPNGIPRRLMPNVAQVATGRKQFLSVYGNDYDTADGTAVRDYTHVSDVAAAHTKLTLRLIEGQFCEFTAYNFRRDCSARLHSRVGCGSRTHQNNPPTDRATVQWIHCLQLQFLSVHGNDYDTADGTAVRDYTHVSDVAAAHTKLTLRLIEGQLCGFTAYNFSYGTSYSVLEMVEAFKNVSGVEIPCKIEPRREGDTAHLVSDCSKALRDLTWRATRDLDTMF